MNKTAVVTGVTGQDGAYLTQLLLDKGYVVYGTHRRRSNFWRIKELGIAEHPNLHLVEHAIPDFDANLRMIEETEPTEVYNLAALNIVAEATSNPIATGKVTGMAALNLLEAIRVVDPKIRFFQASSSEMFGHVREFPQDERTPLRPHSPYAAAKAYAHWMTSYYRESCEMFCAAGILYSHESPLRGLEFVTRKITNGLVNVSSGDQDSVELGNLDAKRDWGYAKEYVAGMHQMLETESPDTYVLATGRLKTVREFVELTCNALNIELAWRGEGLDEVGIDCSDGKNIVKINPDFYRPREAYVRVGNSAKAKKELGWEATMTLAELCELMVAAELSRSGKV